MNQAQKRIYPVAGQTYTLSEITKLYLGDSPFLRISVKGRSSEEWVPTQYDGNLEEICEKNALIADSRWTYVRTTHESIPLFNYARDNDFPLEEIVTVERRHAMEREGGHWVCFRGFPQQQVSEYMAGCYAEDFTRAWDEAHAENAARTEAAEAMARMREQEEVRAAAAAAESEANRPPVSFPIQEMLADPEKAKAYVEDRIGNAEKLRQSLEWNIAGGPRADLARLYTAGFVHRFDRENAWAKDYWGKVKFHTIDGRTREDVFFKTEECFVAWTLAKYW